METDVNMKHEAIAVISHHGQMTADGEGQGHYIFDLKTKQD